MEDKKNCQNNRKLEIKKAKRNNLWRFDKKC